MENIEGLKNELRLKIKECQILHEELAERPFKIKASCNLVKYPESIEKEVNYFQDRINNGEEFYVHANYKDTAVLVLRPIKYDDQIFYGLVVGIENECDIDIFDFVKFQVMDLYEHNID